MARHFGHKFLDAVRGIRFGLRGQSSFRVHFAAALAVVVAGWWLRVTRLEWATLVLCIALVWCAEMINTALEHMARAITRQYDEDLGRALDIGSAAVLVAAVCSLVVGLSVLGYRLGMHLGWWPWEP